MQALAAIASILLLQCVMGDDVPLFVCSKLLPESQQCEVTVASNYIQVHNRSLYYEVWEPVYVPVKNPPVVVLHGGPGAAHFYLEMLNQLCCDGRRVIFYDQVGCGYSDIPVNISTSAPELLTVDYYVEELFIVLNTLAFDRIHLLGHSWGGMLALEYFLQTFDDRIASLTVSGAIANTQEYLSAVWSQRLSTLPDLYLAIINATLLSQDWDNPEYLAAMDFYYSQFSTRIQPIVDCLAETVANSGNEVYLGMWGPNEFTATGTLKYIGILHHN